LGRELEGVSRTVGALCDSLAALHSKTVDDDGLSTAHSLISVSRRLHQFQEKQKDILRELSELETAETVSNVKLAKESLQTFRREVGLEEAEKVSDVFILLYFSSTSSIFTHFLLLLF